jgi:hypothetical protein
MRLLQAAHLILVRLPMLLLLSVLVDQRPGDIPPAFPIATELRGQGSCEGLQVGAAGRDLLAQEGNPVTLGDGFPSRLDPGRFATVTLVPRSITALYGNTTGNTGNSWLQNGLESVTTLKVTGNSCRSVTGSVTAVTAVTAVTEGVYAIPRVLSLLIACDLGEGAAGQRFQLTGEPSREEKSKNEYGQVLLKLMESRSLDVHDLAERISQVPEWHSRR